jgi:hypothetical protein
VECGLHGGGDELRGLRVHDDVPAEQHRVDETARAPMFWMIASQSGSSSAAGAPR